MNTYNKKYRLIEQYGLLLIDLFCTALSYYAAYKIRYRKDAILGINGNWFQMYLVCLLVCLVYNILAEGYHHFFRKGYYEAAVYVLKYNLTMFLCVSAVVYAFRMEGEFSRLVLGYFVVINAFMTYAMRLIFKKVIQVYYKKSRSSDKVLVVTTKQEVEDVLAHIEEDHAWSYEVIGLALVEGDYAEGSIQGIPVVADSTNVIDVARQSAVDVVLIHCPDLPIGELEVLIHSFLAMGVLCHNCVERFNIDSPYRTTGKFANYAVVTYSMNAIDYRRKIVKRIMDIIGGVVGLLITAILLPFVALAIKIDSPGPVFFSQTRIGKNGRRFKMYKFRSMYIDAEERKKELMEQNEIQGLMFKMEKDPRITKVGAFLRKTSIDEFPQFWNVVRGDMSLVGTRPPTEDEFEQYNVYYRRRLSITPGLTGMWQVSGRSDITDFEKVVKLDLKYIDEWSLIKDLNILIRTVGVVLFGKGSK